MRLGQLAMNFLHRTIQALVCWTCLLVVTCQDNQTIIEASENSSSWPLLLATTVHISVSIGALLQLFNAPAPIPRRLPPDVVPLNYTLDLIPEYQHGVFSGHEVVLVKAVNPTKNIFLNAYELLIDESSLSITEQSTGNRVAVVNLEEEKQNQWLVITLATELQQDELYVLEIHFNGTIKTTVSVGILGYTYKGGEDRWIIVTHFEPTGARRAFPCFDEPSFKAVFSISIATPPGRHALSNMPVRDASEPVSGHPGWVWSRFEPTFLMSTYLVGFVISDFVCVKGDRNFSVWVQKGKEAQASLMVQLGPKMLEALEEFTQLPSIMPKLDNIAIPYMSNLASTLGTENWGMTTYTDDYILLDEHKILSSKKRLFMHILAHELSHNWFGNLVTPHFWNELWLKEGFARYLQFLISDKVLPSWEMDKDFYVFVVQRSLYARHPAALSQTTNMRDVRAKYNFRSYDTGAVVIRMLEHILTTEVFVTGLRQYLKTYAFKTATSDQLFEVLDAAAANSSSQGLPAGVRVGEVMRPWLFQSNHPVIDVTRNYSSGIVTICQTDFDEGEHRWWIPLSYTTQGEANFNNTVPRLWLSPNESCINLPEPLAANEWIIVNIQQTGYYIVHYDDENWYLLMDYLVSDQYHKIHILNRAQLLTDLLNLNMDEDLNEEIIQWVSRYLVREKSPIPWYLAIADGTFTKMNETSVLEVMKSFYAMVQGIPTDISSRSTPQIWDRILSYSCHSKMMPECVDDAYKHLKSLQANPANYSIPYYLQDIIFCSALYHKNSSGEDVMFLWKLAKAMEDHTDLVLDIMWCSNSRSHMSSLMEAIVVDGAWLTPKERTNFIDTLCRRRTNYTEEEPIQYVGRHLPPHLRLLKIITVVIDRIPKFESKLSQLWCEVTLEWLTGSPINIFGID